MKGIKGQSGSSIGERIHKLKYLASPHLLCLTSAAEGVHEESGKHSWEVTCNTLPDFWCVPITCAACDASCMLYTNCSEEYEIEPGFVALVDIDVEGYELTLLPALLEWTTEFFQVR